MRIYTVYETNNMKHIIVSVKEGFNWLAFMFSALWAIYNRMWLFTLVILVTNVFIGWAVIKFGGDMTSLMTALIGVAALIGWTSNDLRGYALVKRGYKAVATLLASNSDSAIERYLRKSPINRNKTFRNRAGGPW